MSIAMTGITTGVTGGGWRATVTEWGAVQLWGDDVLVDWHVAADDRWHSPQREAAVRQRRIDGTSVVETRVRIPDGDAVQRVYSVPDDGGLTIIEVENESPLAIAVAFTHAGLLSVRPPSAPIEGIDLPAGSVAFPVGHHAMLTVAIAHDGRGAGALPGGLPTAAGVVRGWVSTVERAGRLLLPDAALAERVVSERCELALVGPEHPDADPVAFLLAVEQLVRMGEKAAAWVPDVAHALEQAVKGAPHDWALAAALDGAEHVLAAAGERRACRDLGAVRDRLQLPSSSLPAEPPAGGARFLAWVERTIVAPHPGGADLFPSGLPAGWEGSNFEVYGVPTGVAGSVSFAIRWHGERPALLWEQSGDVARLGASVLAPGWHTREVKGEALWPAPPGVVPAVHGTPETSAGVPAAASAVASPAVLPGEGDSFS
ncbi:MAG: hypothetical protein WCC60_05775 [Ilumatobacteraceae bacterium]